MPDIYTTRPDIVKQVLKDAGFESQVQPTIIRERPPEITYRFNGKGYYAELYVHDLSELPSHGVPGFPDVLSLVAGVLIGGIISLLVSRRMRPSHKTV